MTIYLYVKTHKVTGLKYLGTTVSKNPHAYKGSGKYWRNHIEKHGYEVDTEILFETNNKEELTEKGLYYSELWNVVESKEWANLKPETGAGGGYVAGSESAEQVSSKLKGHPNWLKNQPESAKQLIKEAQQELIAKLTPEELTARMKNSCCHPDSYTPERAKNISNALTGRELSIEHKKNVSIGTTAFRKTLTQEEKNSKYGGAHSGKTWKLINGKRVWINKENQNY
jgi:hypothetical protein